MSRAEVTAIVPGFDTSRAQIAVSVSEYKVSDICSALNGNATLVVGAGAFHAQVYLTPEQCERLAEMLRKAAHEARCVSASVACAEKADVVAEGVAA